ncbi:hypothetical protein HN51_025922 [Arachis hypogaea]
MPRVMMRSNLGPLNGGDWKRESGICKMQSRRISEVLSLSENEHTASCSFLNESDERKQHDSASALQQFLDRVPVGSISGITDSHVLEVKAENTLKDAIHMLYEKDVLGAVIVDDHVLQSEGCSTMRFSDRFIGFIDFPSMVLWCLREYDKKMMENPTQKDIKSGGFFSIILEQIHEIGQTKIGELAKSFLWKPYFPVRMDDSVMHALLLLSKHRLHVLPVIQQKHFDPTLIALVTQNALVQFLLQSNGLEWFDSIADNKFSDLRVEDQEPPICVYGNQTVADAFKLLWENHNTCAVAVVDQQTKKIMGNVRNSDVYHLLKSDEILKNRTILTLKEFIHMESEARMEPAVTNRENETMKQIMEHMIERNSSFSFLVNEKEQVAGLVTLRDIILQFAPPCVDSSIGGGGFFELALEQSGCCVKNGTIVPNSSNTN